MKILQISPSPPDYLGGLAHYTKFLSKYLGENNIQVDLLCSSLAKKSTKYEKFSKNFRVIKKKCYALADNDNALRMKNPIFNVLTYLLRYGKKYDIIHVHSYIYFSTIQTFFYKLFFGRKIPLILHLHGILEGHVAQTTNKIEKVLFMFKKYFYDLTIGKIMFKKADAVFSVSKEDLLISHDVFKLNLKDKVKAFYIPNAIDPEKFKRLNNIKRKFIGYINRLSTFSGIDLFLELIKNYNKIDDKQEFLIIGKGPYLPEVKKAVENYPIVFYEMIPHDEMVNYYNKCSVIVVITRSEGLSTVLLEALSCEVPGIASDVGGNPELIKNGITGYLFEKANVDQAIKKLLDVKKNNEYEKLGKNGRKLVEDHYSWRKIVNQTILVYKKLKNP